MAGAPQSITFIPPTDPGSYAAAIQLQRRQAIADALLAQSQQPLGADIPQGLRVIPKLGWQGGLIKLGQALMANKLENDVTSQRAALAQQQMQQLGGQFYGQGGGQAPAAAPASTYSAAQGAMAQPGSGQQLGPTVAAASQIPQDQAAPPAAAAPQGGPMTIPGMDPGVSMRLFMSNPEEYWKALAAARAPTTEQKNWSAQGVDPRQLAGGTVLAGQRAGMTDIEKLQDAARRAGPGSPEAAQLQEAISKANYLAPIDAKPGTPLIDPRTGKPTFFAPKTADGIGLNFEDPLHPTAYALPGYSGANAGIAGAEQGARQNNTVFTGVQGPSGAPMSGFGGQMFGGAAGGGGAPAPRAPAAAAAPGGAPGGMPPARPAVAPTAQPQRSGVITGQTPTDAAIGKAGADVIASAPQQVAQSRGTITGLEQALNLVESGIKTGPGTGQSINVLALLNNMHVPLMKGDVDGYQTMQKYLQNSLNGAAAGTSAGGSDARFESFMHGQPNAETMNGPALSSAIRYVLAQHDATVARGNFLGMAYKKAQADGDPNAAQTAQTQWAGVYNPEYFRIGRLAPSEQLAAVNAMSKNQAAHFMQWRQSMGAFQ